jgi:small subunit ribosomal protein S3Ae
LVTPLIRIYLIPCCRYDIKAPSVFKVRQVGKTLVNRTAGTRIASDGLKGRVYEVSLADLQSENDAERSFRKFKLICEDVQVQITN